MPVPESELPLLSSLVQIRVRLTALKKDRTEYVRAKDVFEIYREVLQVGECWFAFAGAKGACVPGWLTHARTYSPRCSHPLE